MIRCVPAKTPRYGLRPRRHGSVWTNIPAAAAADIYHCHAPALHRGLGSGGRAHPFQEETL
jgi:hypothetical protein